MTRKNAFYAQSGGVSAVINALACFVLEEIGKVYAGRNGIIGALTEDLIDTGVESEAAIAALKHTPGAAFGSCLQAHVNPRAPRAIRALDRSFSCT